MPTTAAEPPSLHVAVGVVLDRQGRVLVSLRHAAAHQGGLWEFPGGKVEAGETVSEALARELREELSIRVLEVSPLLEVRHDYGDRRVLLDVWWVSAFEGQPRGLEGQRVRWVGADAIRALDFPAANRPVLEAVLQSGRLRRESRALLPD